MKKKILVVSQYYFPEQFRINDICEEWVKRGYDVTVLTGIPNYPEGAFFEGYGIFSKRKEIHNGVNIKRLPLIPRKKSSVFLALNYLSFMISGYFWAIFTREKFDEVFIYEVSPMTQAIPGIKYAKKHKINSIIYVMDLWPENFVEMSGIKNKFIIKSITSMVKYIYRNVSRIFISSPGFKEKITNLGNFEEKIEYWPQYAEDFYMPTDEKSENIQFDLNNFNITFAGNIGYAQGLEILPSVAEQLSNRKIKAHFNIIGNGRFKEELIKEVENKNIEEYFSFYEPVVATEIPKIMNMTDVALVSLSRNPLFSLTIPAKVQSILATGTPILVSADGILETIVNDSEAGLFSRAGEIDGLAKNIELLTKYSEQEFSKLRQNAKKYSENEFSKEKLLNIIDGYWEEK